MPVHNNSYIPWKEFHSFALGFCYHSLTHHSLNVQHHIAKDVRNRNILISTDGPSDSVIKTKPALCFTKENAKRVVRNIDEVLKTYAE
jgi:4-aminobutyrate aminotransferase-like enzyme